MEMTQQERWPLKQKIFCAPLGRQIEAAEKLKVLAASHVIRKVASVLRHVRRRSPIEIRWRRMRQAYD
jgi:hypothetical protein